METFSTTEARPQKTPTTRERTITWSFSDIFCNRRLIDAYTRFVFLSVPNALQYHLDKPLVQIRFLDIIVIIISVQPPLDILGIVGLDLDLHQIYS